MMKPRNNNLIIELIGHQQTASGLEMSTREDDKDLRSGKVLRVPEGVEDIKVNDIVVFGEYSYVKIYFKGQQYCFVNIEDIVAVEE